MKKVKNIKISLISIITLVIMILTLLPLSEIKAEANDNVTDLVGAATGQPEKKVIQAYSFTASTYPRITQFPIDAAVFNSDVHFFCAQRGVPYGGQSNYRDTQLGDGTYHRGNTVTKRVVGHGSHVNDMNGDVPSGADFYINTSGSMVEATSYSYYSYKESTESPVDYVYTNWWYTSTDLKFDCEGTDEEAGLAFLLACFISGEGNNNYHRGSYREDPMQHAIWASFINTGNKESNPLKKANDAYVKYHKDSKDPNVNTKPDDHVGTTVNSDESVYTVGPFFMYDYVEAKDYESQKVDTRPASSTSTEDTNIEVDPDEIVCDTMAGGEVVSENVTLQENFGDSHKGTIIKAEAVVSNGSSTKRIEIPIPEGGKNYNINLSASDINGYDELQDIIFTYQRVHASANGTRYEGRQYRLKFSQKSSSKSACKYNCTEHNPSYASHSTGYTYGGSQTCTYTWDCDTSGAPKVSSHYCDSDHSHYGCNCDGYTLSCSSSHHSSSCYSDVLTCSSSEEGHSHGSGCYTEKRTCGTSQHSHSSYGGSCYSPVCAGTHSCYSYCNCPGHSDTHTAIFKCPDHSHEACEKFYWQYDGKSGDYAQDGFAGSGVLVNEIIEYKVSVKVPLKTKMRIYKYITKVEHTETGGTNDLTVPDRSGKTYDQKKNDTVKIERGDKVTYEIKIKNDSRFPTAIKVKDTLPSPISNLVIDARFEYRGLSGTINTANWIEVPAKDEVVITMSLVAEADSGTHENRVEFITKNHTSEHMKYTSWGADSTHGVHTYGDIVNVDTSREMDGDFYTIKEYDVTIDKYITNVKHATNGVSTFNGTTRIRQPENSKSSNPVYAEFGDIVTYKIDIYNTKEEYMTGGFSDREGSPFWSPDIVYVDVKDTLPKKYSDLDVTTTDGSGNLTIADGSFTMTNVKVPAGGKVTVTVTLVVEEVKRNTLEENKAEMVGKVRNVNLREIKNHSTKTTSSDWYKINDYNISIDKFISKYESPMTKFNNDNGFTNNETTTLADRYEMTEDEKATAPVQAEKTDIIEYTIRVKNDATAGAGLKYATQVRPTRVQDVMDAGLTFKSVTGTMYASKDNPKYENLQFEYSNSGNTYYFDLADKIGDEYLILNPGEWIDYKVTVEVTKSNMFLHSLKNTVSYTTLTNINNVTGEKDRIVTTENITGQKSSSEYVKLKDLVIAGRVWLDTDKDGFMGIKKNGVLQTGSNAIVLSTNPTTGVDKDKEYAMQGIIVRLYREGAVLPERTTITDSNGFFTFSRGVNGKDEGDLLKYFAGEYHAVAPVVTESDQRIPKATKKDEESKNYAADSELINYYIEYEYDGLVYKSTAVYSNDSNINDNGSLKEHYQIDSNAAEYKAQRQDYNKRHETITYNTAFGKDEKGANIYTDLAFKKEGHISYIREDYERYTMKSRSFINIDSGEINYLWLPDQSKSTNDNKVPKAETEYLKYINLGLELRDQFDLRLSKDLIDINVDINGYNMRYDYAKMPDGELYDRADIYELYYYKSDYAYRYTMYSNEEVRNAKGENSELKMTLNYTIKVYNESPDQTYAKINEIVDYSSESMTIDSAKYVVGTNADGTKETIDMEIKQSPTYLSKAPTGHTFAGYETNFLTWKEGTAVPTIGKGESLTIDLVYKVDRLCDLFAEGNHEVDEDRRLLIKNEDILGAARKYLIKTNVAQIYAYSTYEDAAATKPKGLVDCDSNAGNINNAFADNHKRQSEDANNCACRLLYDDDESNAGIGCFEDNAFRVRVKMLEKDDERKVTGFVFEDTRSEKITGYNQFVGNGVYNDGIAGVFKDEKHDDIRKMFERYGLTIDPNQDLEHDTKLDGMTVELVQIVTVDGKQYEETIDPLARDTKENIIVRTQSGDTGNQGEYTLNSFIPGVYIVRFRYGDMYTQTGDMTYNSLLHNGQDYKSATYATTVSATDKTLVESSMDNKVKYNALIQQNLSDARDNELRRIEVMAHSETMTNDIAEFLKYGNYLLRDDDGNLVVDGDGNYTVVAKGQEIKLNKDIVYKYKLEDFANATNAFADTVTIELAVEQREHTEWKNDDYTEINLTYEGNTSDVNLELPNIDFGVTFRPENYLELIKQIKSIKLTTSAGEVLVDIKYDLNGEVDEENSKGLENVQAIDNKKITTTLTAETQGFRYINVDEEVLQGATMSVEYYMFVDNIGEVDTVNKFLIDKGYSSGVLAAFNKEENRAVIKSNKGANENYIRMSELISKTFGESYAQGLLVGNIYYKGKDGGNTDVVVPIKPSKILDLVDNDATFSVQNNSVSDKFWTVTDEKELKEKGLVDERRLFESTNYKDLEGRYYTTYKEDLATSEDIYSKTNLAINVPSEGENPSFVKEIYPEYTDKDGATSSYITIQVDAVLAGDTATEDMVYDNIAEIVEYISPVGRRTNFASTIGNIELKGDIDLPPYAAAQIEVDTDGTEVIRLTPPTGMMETELFISGNRSTIHILIIAVAAIVLIYIIRFNLKGRIGKSKFYK